MYRAIPVFLAFFAHISLASTPVVNIEYSQSLDSVCSFFKGPKIEEAWKDELSQRLEGFQLGWSTVGTQLLVSTEQITGNRFSRDTITAYLTLCGIPSQSIVGVSVNMRYALATFTDEPVSFSYKTAILYHEILHGFVARHLPGDSQLLSLRVGEHSRVIEHLHLLALIKSVYIEQGMKKELEEVIEIDGRLPGGVYKRAWEIVNEDEFTYKLYVAEISQKQP